MTDYTAEDCLLGAVLRKKDDENAALVVVDKVKPEQFESLPIAATWRAIHEQGTIDFGTLVNALRGDRAFDGTTPHDFLYATINAPAGLFSKHKEYVASILKAYRVRKRIELAARIERDAADDDKFEMHLADAVENASIDVGIQQISEGHLDVLSARLTDPDHDIVPCHIPRLNKAAPLRRGHVTVIAAHTGLGKTTFGLNAAKAAADHGCASLIISLEMRRQELCDRMLAQVSGVELAEIQRYRSASNSTRQKIRQGLSGMAELPIHVVDAFARTPAGVLSQCRKHMRKHKFDLLVLDYLQLLEPNKQSGNRTVDVASCSRAMKNLANELNVAVLLVSQFNRHLQPGERPQKRHLKESSSIEQDASMIMFLHGEQTDEQLELLVDKNRLGESSLMVKVNFERTRCTFSEAAPAYLEPNEALTEFACPPGQKC